MEAVFPLTSDSLSRTICSSSGTSFSQPSPSYLKIACVELLTKTLLQVCVAYIRPNSPPNYYSDVFSYISSIACNPQSIVMGDFNLLDICWSTLNRQSVSFINLCDLVFRHNLTQFIHFPTHFKGSILDVILFCSPDRIQSLTIVCSR